MIRDSERIYDEYLVLAARSGDDAALTRLVARWQPRLLRHAWRLAGDAHRAKDIVQEAWLDILRALPRLDDVAAFPAWAFRIVSRRASPARERAGAWREAADAVALDAAAVDDDAGRGADTATVARALAALPPGQRAALALFYLEDLSVAEIAVALDIPPGTVKTRLMHARRKLRATLEGDDDGQD